MSKFDEALEDINDRVPHGKDTDECLAGHWCMDNWDAVLTALTQAAEIERGDKVVVDREATSEMIREGLKEYYHPEIPDLEGIYKAMITASEGK